MQKIIYTIILLAIFSGASAQEKVDTSDSKKLLTLYKEDQDARSAKKIDWDIVSKKDKERRKQVLDIIKRGNLRSAKDYYHASMIFQHSGTADEIRTAFSLAWLSSAIDPENDSARWLSAAAWDRIMMREDMPQWYGTQFYRPSPDEPWELYQIDESAVTDEDRKRMKVRTLAESRSLLSKMNNKALTGQSKEP